MDIFRPKFFGHFYKFFVLFKKFGDLKYQILHIFVRFWTDILWHSRTFEDIYGHFIAFLTKKQESLSDFDPSR